MMMPEYLICNIFVSEMEIGGASQIKKRTLFLYFSQLVLSL